MAFAIKWVASIIQIMGYTATGFGWTPWNLYLFLAGVLGWFAVGVLWNDRAITISDQKGQSLKMRSVSYENGSETELRCRPGEGIANQPGWKTNNFAIFRHKVN